jgi:hypothetical protein
MGMVKIHLIIRTAGYTPQESESDSGSGSESAFFLLKADSDPDPDACGFMFLFSEQSPMRQRALNRQSSSVNRQSTAIVPGVKED